MKFKKQYLVLVNCLLLLFVGINGQATAGADDPLFTSDDILNLEISYNFNAFRKDKREKRGYHSARLSYTDSQGRMESFDVRIRVRGKFRRTQLNCRVPNFRIKFSPQQTANTLFAGQENLKLVAHCKRKPKHYQIYAFNEYYIYKTYQILSPLHYKVRLVRMTYIDNQNKVKPFSHYAFFLENSKRMAKRLKARRVKAGPNQILITDPYAANVAAVFQYMIGNSDWSFFAGHNMVYVIPAKRTKHFPIPYDFDQTGLVNPEYAKVDPRLNIKYVHERLFRGFNKDPRVFAATFKIFHQHKEEIINIYRNSPFLPDKQKKRIIKYLEEFYKIINNPKLVKRLLINSYRGRTFPKR